jgi:hypothetical protein
MLSPAMEGEQPVKKIPSRAVTFQAIKEVGRRPLRYSSVQLANLLLPIASN